MKVPLAGRLTFSGQFLLFGLVVLFAGMLTIGLRVQHEIRQVVIARTADVTALFVDSFIAHHVEALDENTRLDAGSVEALNDHLMGTSLGRDFVTVKLWAPDGTIAYGTNEELVGRAFPIGEDLRRAFGGEIISRVTDLAGSEHEQERLVADSLIETYAPVYVSGADEAVAVAEFYQRPDALLSEIGSAQLRGWLIVVTATVVMYLMLVGLARGASRVIESQRVELEGNVTRLSGLLTQNQALHERMRDAAWRVTALNEQYLRRISADLHDGPAQNIALAKLRVEALVDGAGVDRGDLKTIDSALGSALTDIRSIARGLRIPEIGPLSPADTARRVIRDFERATRTKVDARVDVRAEDAPVSVKITLYRVLQEALANSYKHAAWASRHVNLTTTGDTLTLAVADDGPGFDPETLPSEASLGLDGMRERVEMLGGGFELTTAPGEGTQIRIHLPLRGTVDD